MFKWQAVSPIGRVSVDIVRATDGIASSLRLFHISAGRAVDDGSRSSSRAQRSAAAAAEVSSLAPPPRGIDARSLAATPPPVLTIRRVEYGSSSDSPIRLTRGAADLRRRGGVAPGRGGFAARGNARGGMRGGIRGGMRGALQGRGTARGRGRGGKRGRGRRSAGPSKSDGSDELMPLTEEEQAYVDGIEMGIETPYEVNMTTRADLDMGVPPIATNNSAPIGAVSSILDRMRALSGQRGTERSTVKAHRERYSAGQGTLYTEDEYRAREDYILEHRSRENPLRGWNFDVLDEDQRNAILRTMNGGAYAPLQMPEKKDTLGVMKTYAQRNETYMPPDATSIQAKVQVLLATQKPALPRRQSVR